MPTPKYGDQIKARSMPLKYGGNTKSRGSKASNKEYLAPTIVRNPYLHIQSPHYTGTWTLRDIDSSSSVPNEASRKEPRNRAAAAPKSPTLGAP